MQLCGRSLSLTLAINVYLSPAPPLPYPGRYLEVHLRSIPGLVSSVYNRALRNCYWVGSLWARAIRAEARGSGATGAAAGAEDGAAPKGMTAASLEAQEDLYNRAIKAGLQVP